jgi:hypothetical protein
MHGFGRQPPARDLALTSKSHVHEGQAETNLLIVVTKRAEEREREPPKISKPDSTSSRPSSRRRGKGLGLMSQ